LRYLQTLKEMSSERNATIIVPFPVELLKAFMAVTKRDEE
jgi:hypothetical protein